MKRQTTLDKMHSALDKNSFNFKQIDIKKMIPRKTSDKDIKKITKYLQGLFYPTFTNDSNYNRLTEKIKQYIGEKVGKTIESFDFSQEAFSSIDKDKPIEIMADYETFSHKNYIQISTLERRLNEAQTALRKPNLSVDTLENIKKFIIDTSNLLYNTENVEFLGNDRSKNISIIKVNAENGELIKSLDILFKDLSYFKELTLPAWIKGEVFEKSLEFFSQNIQNEEEEIVGNLLDSVFSQKTIGGQIASRENLSSNNNFSIEKTVEKDKKGKLKTTYQAISKDEKIKISGAFSEKQGKMDILFALPNDLSPKTKELRVSAKNWSTIDINHNFGESTVSNILLRTNGLQDTIYMGLLEYYNTHNLLNEKPNSWVTAFKRGRIMLYHSVFLDTVMGYSQKNNYTDHIIINDRKNSKIRVFSIRQLFEKYIKQDMKNYIKGYDVYNNTVFQKISSLNDSSKLMSVILGEFSQYKLGISANILNL